MVCTLLSGCHFAGERPAEIPSHGTQVKALGDWNDVEAAAEVAVRIIEAVVERVEVLPGRTTFELVTATDEPGALVAERGVGDQIGLSARVGRFGDRRREERLLEAMRARLAQLHGVNTAPLR